MKRLSQLAVSALSVASLLGIPAAVNADAYKVDPVHSDTGFHIHHFGAGYVIGIIPGVSGTVSYDKDNPDQDSFVISIDVTKILTGNAKRDSDLEGPDWFDVKEFPTMDFKSTAVKKTGDDAYDVTGDLTIHGVTKSVTVPMTMTGVGQGMQGETRVGFEGKLSINRNDYGMSNLPGAVGDDVGILVELEVVPQ